MGQGKKIWLERTPILSFSFFLCPRPPLSCFPNQSFPLKY